MNVLDFCTGQVFDWFIASDTAFALIERVPTVVTGNVGNLDCGAAAEVALSRRRKHRAQGRRCGVCGAG